VAALLWAVPHLREYGWHNMMQLAAFSRFGTCRKSRRKWIWPGCG